MKIVLPKVYFIGATAIRKGDLFAYLLDTGNQDFLTLWDEAFQKGLTDIEILCSFYAKLCYNSLSLGKNANVSKTRSIKDNFKGCIDSKHLSILEHVCFNFIVSDCSRVFTHEMVRHRVGVAYSQMSGRYCRLDELKIVVDPTIDLDTSVLEPLEKQYAEEAAKLDGLAFKEKKRWTSALRRLYAPSGLANEFGFSINLRQLRHVLVMRTSRHADWEIRNIFNQIYLALKELYPIIFYGLRETDVDGYLELTEKQPNVCDTTKKG